MINIYWFGSADCETFICLQIRLIPCDTYLESSPYSMVVSLEDLVAEEIDWKLTKNSSFFDPTLISQPKFSAPTFKRLSEILYNDSIRSSVFKFFA